MPPDEPGMTFDAAALALAQANAGTDPGRDPATGLPPAQAAPTSDPAAPPAPPVPGTQADPGAAPQGDSNVIFGFDVSTLPDELRDTVATRLREAQADYTRKTQEVAPWRKLGDLGVDPAAAEQAVRFAQALQSDPTYAAQVYNELGTYLQQTGIAPPQGQQPAPPMGDPSMDDMGEPLDPVQQQLQELQAWKHQQEEAMQMQAFVAQVERQARAIHEQDPSIQTADMDRIYALAPGYNGDLMQAHQAYTSMRDELIRGYLEQKASAPLTATPGTPGPGQQPVRFESVDQAHKAAEQHLANMLAQG